MYLYNSASHRKEVFKPNNPKLITMYTCGPTVYHYAHIGNLRSYIMEDILEKISSLPRVQCKTRNEHYRCWTFDQRR